MDRCKCYICGKELTCKGKNIDDETIFSPYICDECSSMSSTVTAIKNIIKRLKCLIDNNSSGNNSSDSANDYVDRLKGIVKVLEKLVPEPPKIFTDDTGELYQGCPACKTDTYEFDYSKFKIIQPCPACGQMIDWSNE